MTPKQEHFARLYVETGNASEAYRQAYNAENMKPETVTNEAYKLLQSPDISAMVDDLKAEARQRHRVIVDDLLHELEQARAAALAAPTPQSSAAVSATMVKANYRYRQRAHSLNRAPKKTISANLPHCGTEQSR